MGTVYVRWVDSKLMTGIDSRGATLVMGTWTGREPEWKGLKPSDLLLLAAASCSAYDVAVILNKQREPILGLEVECTGNQAEEAPHAFTDIHLHYTVEGECNFERVARAIRLSEEKYCSVLNTLRPGVRLSSDFEVKL
jgi:putative redox protein